MNTRSRTSGFIWGGLLIIIGALALLDTFIELSPWVWVGILAAGAVAIYGVYTIDRTDRWLLIVAYAMLAVAGLVALLTLNVLADSYVATYVMFAIGLPFLIAFLQNRTRWGLLIPAYVLFVIGVFVPLTETGVLEDTVTVTFILFAIAIPFFVVYIRDTKNWWALIPGGILAVIGLAFLIAEGAVAYVFGAVFIIAGFLIVLRQLTRREEPLPLDELTKEEAQDS